MPTVVGPLAGAITIALIVVLGTFVYPAWLRSAPGRWGVAASTVLLGVLFYSFDRPDAVGSLGAMAFAAIWALAPLGAGLLVWRLQTR
jgi:hypothetical protein